MTPAKYFESSERDRGLMEALTFLDAHTLSHGIPDWIANDPKRMGEFETGERHDFALEALEKEREKGDDKTPWKSRFVYHADD